MSKQAIPPGPYIRTDIIPRSMNVTQAAKLLGVGRSALSNLLNGKAGLSPEMAMRIERAFGARYDELVGMQAAYDAEQAATRGTPSNTRTNVPPFLAIRANDIVRWASNELTARIRLPVLMRTLVHSTSTKLTKVHFSGNDDGERKGWDGTVEAAEASPWVPQGTSCWEMGVSAGVLAKANADYTIPTVKTSVAERLRTTFIFVTPRKWPGRDTWQATKLAEKQWRDVRAYDADTLEQWIEQSLAAQAWFANEAGIETRGVRSLTRCWSDWSEATSPALSSKLFAPVVQTHKDKLASYLKTSPTRSLIVSADSTDEAVAFLSQALGEHGDEELSQWGDRTLVFGAEGTLPKLAQSNAAFLAITSTRDVELELAPYAHKLRSILVYPRNAPNVKADIALEAASHDAFRSGLADMGLTRHEADKRARETGRSLTVLRRQLAASPAIKTPSWANDAGSATSLVSFMLIGAWHSRNAKDQEAVKQLSQHESDDDVEREVARLVALDDAPMWSVGEMRGVVSKIDLLYLVAHHITKSELLRFYTLARSVLGEHNPALDLDEGQQALALMLGKVRTYSSTLRLGIAETLVLLAAHGNDLFRDRTGIDTESQAAKIVKELLPSPLTERALLAHEHDLPTYAEAAPDCFLTILEGDLAAPNPVTLTWMTKVRPGVFGGSPVRASLLWALEALCWNPNTLTRAARILSQLAQVQIADRWANKPLASLKSVLHSSVPQTAATVEQRIELLKDLETRCPEIAWQISLAQIGYRMELFCENFRPRWRADAAGYGGVETRQASAQFTCAAIELVLGRSTYSLAMLSDLVEHVEELTDAHQSKVWRFVEAWAQAGASDDDRAKLRETVRVRTRSMRAKRRAKLATVSDAAQRAYIALEPKSLLIKHAWLFRESWVEESYDELYADSEHDYVKRGERIHELRLKALQDVYAAQGLVGLLDVSMRGNATREIGHLCARRLLNIEENVALIQKAIETTTSAREHANRLESLISGVVYNLHEEPRDALLALLKSRLSESEFAALLVESPFIAQTWKFVDLLGDEAQRQYWQKVVPQRHFEVDPTEGVLRLIEAERPKAALSIIDTQSLTLEIRILYRILSDIVKHGKEKQTDFPLKQYTAKQAFKWIGSSTELSVEEKAILEFRYLNILAPLGKKSDNPGVPNLEKYLEIYPALFVKAVVWCSPPSDDNVDPEEHKVEPTESERLADQGQALFHAVREVPFCLEKSGAQLREWVTFVRDECAKLARREVADARLGELFAYAPVGQDEIWPCEAVRQVMETVHSDALMQHTGIGIYNSRGVYSRGYDEGGKQERELAAKYRRWADQLSVSHPYVATRLLREIAKSYEDEAKRADNEVAVRRRLGH